MLQCVSLKGILPFHSAFRIRQSWHACPTTQSMPMLRIAGAELLNIVYEQEPHHARVAVYHCQDGGSVAVSKSSRFPRRISSFVCAGNRQHGPKQDDEGRKAASQIGGNPSCRVGRALQRISGRLRWWICQKSTPTAGTKLRDCCRQGLGSRWAGHTLCVRA
jgi:hypothetical protein